MSTKLTGIFANQNYVIFSGISIACVSVLYFYKFHLITITASYVLGCLACYSGLKSSALHNFLSKLRQSFSSDDDIQEILETPAKGCDTCGSQDCSRHDATLSLEPWVGLKVHKQLDQAIEDFYNAILEQFITSWYNKVSPQPFFVDELRQQLRYASACLLRRAIKVDYCRLITERLLPCALRHCGRGAAGAGAGAVHPAAATRGAELRYLRGVAAALMPHLLRAADLHNAVFRVLVREIFSGWVLLPLTDVLADPYILNTFIILATGHQTMAQLPTTPNYKVEFLQTFVRQNDTLYMSRGKMLRIDLEHVLNDQEYFYAFMQFMKTTGHFHLLQFCKEIKSFQTRILNPELTSSEQEALFKEAWKLWVTYFDLESPTSVSLEPGLVEEMRLLLADGAPNVKKLQTSKALYQAARQSHVLLEKVMLPKFLHSEECYKLLHGTRVPTGYHKQMAKKHQEKLLTSALKLGSRLRGALRSQTLDGQIMDYSHSNADINNIELMENVDLIKYLAQEEDLRQRDLSTCKVVLTRADTRLHAPPRRGAVRVFTLAVHRAGPRRADLLTPQRTEDDFHLLRSKLLEFHGDAALQQLALPSRRDNSPLETIRYKYEDFLQRLLQMSLLRTSGLLRIFLTEEGDFEVAVQAASLAAGSDLTNMYQTVAHRLRKEKGQHLEGFMNVLLMSSDRERWGPTRRDVEIGQEADEEVELQARLSAKRSTHSRSIHSAVFNNNFDVEVEVLRCVGPRQTAVVGFTQCLIYLLVKVVNAHSVLVNILGSIIGLLRESVDQIFNKYFDVALRNLLSERRLAHLIRLGHGMLFRKKPSLVRCNADQHREMAREQLLNKIPSFLKVVLGPNLQSAILNAFDIIQKPHLNKQLVYNLFDLCLIELFPELDAIDANGKEPKS